ncbi:MAG: polysaccharide biosynthesis/export family protein [Blastocatellia bacterium]|nr:polysaccharide biosynthesis/export family protein [Blastocatellia bacterium]
MISVITSKRQRSWQIYLMVVLLIMGMVRTYAQDPKPEQTKEQEQKKEYVPEKDDSTAVKKDDDTTVKKDKTTPAPAPKSTKKKPANTNSPPNSSRILTDAERSALRREDSSEAEAAILPYINNFYGTLRLGPEDIITVDVFDQPLYTRANITIPPNGRINYPLIGQIMVAGRTTEELEKEITERLIEYIIDPKVTVSVTNVHSLKFLVLGDVNAPGIYEMPRRMTITEGLARAGYFSKYGKRTDVTLVRNLPGSKPMPMKVNVKEIERGHSEDVFLVPGDMIVVSGNALKTIDQIIGIVYVAAWARVVAQ